ncbi:UDP-2,3-diacylglucosamine diphosphatase [Vibrio sp. SM6]|uniref:UDP-2,3-diacylglucosamine hydrolase n=1 Tax=Vibrio agarilyticus TaxID=2726741 RepID=A0A7X8TMF3_9VIBR|nr:UDP-2,3-diacylglucosamine diphosphatase [Vibrio agarilyticus]NLS11433.1 UDP-2,3-diacylglucosamine diphosphatase [Vibrio agarilyticus]
MTTLFISDLHLAANRPDITTCFLNFLHCEAIDADALYILGDLFEFWTGDDDPTPFASQIRQALHALTTHGVPVYFIQGNRDFLLGETFCQQTGVILLPDVTEIDLYGQRAVILHGDTLCTDDERYQAFRRKVHQPWLQWLFKRLPWRLRTRIVSKVQHDIRDDKQTKSMTIMDVNAQEVATVMAQHHVNLMIHGHTHRPAIHEDTYEGSRQTRIVLGDWYEQASILYVDKSGYSLKQHALTHNNEQCEID